MALPVRLRPLAERDLEEAYLNAARHAPVTAANWLQRFRDALDALAENPQRHANARESKRFQRDLRQTLFGRKLNVFRIVFEIRVDGVDVLRIRRASRRPLRRADLDES